MLIKVTQEVQNIAGEPGSGTVLYINGVNTDSVERYIQRKGGTTIVFVSGHDIEVRESLQEIIEQIKVVVA